MPRKKTKKKKVESEPTKEEYTPDEDLTDRMASDETEVELQIGVPSATAEESPKEEPKAEPKPTDIVRVQVVFGSVTIDTGEEKSPQYTKGEVFTVSRKRAETIDPRFVKILD